MAYIICGWSRLREFSRDSREDDITENITGTIKVT